MTVATANPGGGLGAAVPDKTLGYDPDTGDQTTLTSIIGGTAQTISTSSDADPG